MNAAMLCIARRTADESTSHRPTANDPQADDEGAAEVVFALCSCNCDCETAALVRALSLGCPPARSHASAFPAPASLGLPRSLRGHSPLPLSFSYSVMYATRGGGKKEEGRME